MDKLGAWPQRHGVDFRVWAPQCESVDVIAEGGVTITPLALAKKDGYFTGHSAQLKPGDYYKLRVDGQSSFPDPCSRFQPQGPHGPSMIVDPSSFKWEDADWQKSGLTMKGQVIYEIHVGTFSSAGTYAGIIPQLKELKDLGITVLEIMPVAEFPGLWSWGYDGVALFAPAHEYGSPDDLRNLINEAHKLGMAVILDVVYNHLGPDGNYLKVFSKDYFADLHTTDWGEAINFYGPNSKPVREFFIANACYWIEEFHFDGLRLDATQNIYDKSHPHILAEMSQAVRKAGGHKKIIMVAENESQEINLIQPVDKDGHGLDGMWNDDFHHSVNVKMNGKREAYYTDYEGTPSELIAMMKYGFLYQGQFYAWQNKPRGTYVSDDIKAEQFITFLENHDQVANSLDGRRNRLLSDAGIYRAITALWLLSPGTPMFFMGQEFGATTPFLFFADHHHELAPLVFKGRKEFLAQFPSIRAAEDVVIDPKDKKAFELCKLDFAERQKNKEIYQLHKDLLRLRREDEVFKQQDRTKVDGAVLSEECFVVRYKGAKSDRLLVVNFGNDHDFSPCPQPLLAPLPNSEWDLLWSSHDVKYGGLGTARSVNGNYWYISGRGAQVFASTGE